MKFALRLLIGILFSLGGVEIGEDGNRLLACGLILAGALLFNAYDGVIKHQRDR